MERGRIFKALYESPGYTLFHEKLLQMVAENYEEFLRCPGDEVRMFQGQGRALDGVARLVSEEIDGARSVAEKLDARREQVLGTQRKEHEQRARGWSRGVHGPTGIHERP